MKKWNRRAKLVLFKAESNVSDAQLRKAAVAKMKACSADLVVANDVSRKGAGFGVETNEALVISRNGKQEKVKGRKGEIAGRIFGLL